MAAQTQNPPRSRSRTGLGAVLAALVLAGFAVGGARAASNDGNIEPDGVWHDGFDVFPRAPARNEAFALELRSFRYDLTGLLPGALFGRLS